MALGVQHNTSWTKQIFPTL